MSITPIKKEEIDFDKIYSTKADAINSTNNVKVQEIYWGDNGDLELNIDDETGVGMVTENGVGLGFVNKDSIIRIEETGAVETSSSTESMYNGSFRDDSDIMKQKSSDSIEIIAKQEGDEVETQQILEPENGGNQTIEEIQTEEAPVEEVPVEAPVETSTPAETAPEVPTETTQEVTPIATGTATPEDFNFKHEDSNILAAKAKNMGFTDDQIKIAIGISRYETGNYQHLAYGYNYGGVTGNGDLGKEGGYAKYSSKDVGMDAYLSNLKTNYFDQGLNTVESMSRKYLGYEDTSGKWTNGVYGSMS